MGGKQVNTLLILNPYELNTNPDMMITFLPGPPPIWVNKVARSEMPTVTEVCKAVSFQAIFLFHSDIIC